MAVQPLVARRWQQATGVPLLEGYGLTETSPIACANPVDATDFSGKLGLPVPSTEVAILDEDGNELPPGSAGEICVRGPQVMQGYWRQPEETARVLSPDGWLRTGDIGRMDERGWFEFVDRSKDIIVVSGFKAFPAEIEEAVRAHCERHLTGYKCPRFIELRAELPRTPLGKVLHRQLKDEAIHAFATARASEAPALDAAA